MTKRLVVFITSLFVLIFIIGCSESKPELIESTKPEPPKTEAPQGELIESTKPEPPKTEVLEIKQPKVEPPEIKPPEVEPPRAEPPKAEPPEVEAPQVKPKKAKPYPTVSFHDKCTDVLSTFVNDKGMVDYKTLKRKKLEFKQLLSEFARLDPNEYNSWPKEDKIAFWLNTYNIQMLKIIVDNYPIKSTRWRRIAWPPTSIRHIPPVGVIGASKWDRYKFVVMDEVFTLAEIEQRLFRKEFGEPLVFFALFHASLSSPTLRSEPYYGHKLYEQLDDQVKKYLSSHLAFRIDRKKQRVYLSALLQPGWYGKEFIRKYDTAKKFKDKRPAVRAVLNFVTNYIPEQDVSYLETGNYSVKYINYDWRLNDSL